MIKVKKNIPGLFGTFIILCSIACAVFAYFIAPDKSPFANEMHLELGTLRPGTEVSFLRVPKLNTTNTSFLDQLLGGKVSNYKAIPVSSYTKYDSTISYTQYGINYPKIISIRNVFSSNDQSVLFKKTYYL